MRYRFELISHCTHIYLIQADADNEQGGAQSRLLMHLERHKFREARREDVLHSAEQVHSASV